MKFPVLCAVVIATVFVVGQCRGDLFGTQDLAQSEYGTINQNTGQFDVIFRGPKTDIRGLAYDPVSDLFFGVSHDAPTGVLVSIDFRTGQTQVVGKTNAAHLNGLTYHTAHDILYAASPGALWSIDQSTGEATAIGNTGLGTDNLAYNPFDNQLYATVTRSPIVPSLLVTIDASTGAATIVAELDAAGRGLIGLAIDPVTGVFYGTNAITDSFHSIDPETGVTTLIGPTGQAISGLTFGQITVPEPSTGLVAIACMVFAAGRWRKIRR